MQAKSLEQITHMGLDPKSILDPSVVQDPYPFYEELRRTAPVWRADDAPIFLVSTYELVCEAARRIEDFSSHLKVLLHRTPDGLLAAQPTHFGSPALATADPPVHTTHKQLLFPRFVAKRMELIEPEVAAFVKARLDQAYAKREFDFMEELGGPVPIHAISTLIGFRDPDERALLQISDDSTDFISGTKTLEEFGAAQFRINEIGSWLEALLDERDGTKTDDLMDAVKSAIVSGQLTKGEGVMTMIILLGAGGDSTGNLLGNSVRILAERPDLQNRLKADQSLIPLFIEEAARLESPFRLHLRSTPRDTDLGGVQIPQGSTLLLMWGSANRDAAKFEKPTDLVLDRPREHVVFGRGIHQCVGNALARMEARVVLTAMLQRGGFPELSSKESPEWRYNLQVRRHKKLPLVLN
jgi:cytochrome P450